MSEKVGEIRLVATLALVVILTAPSLVQGASLHSFHSTKIRHRYQPPIHAGYENDRPEVAAAAQYVQYYADHGKGFNGERVIFRQHFP